MNPRTRVIRALAARLERMQPLDKTDVALFGVMAGALHSLDKAVQLGYQDQRGQSRNASIFGREFRTTLKKIARGHAPPHQWLAGFYFLSGLMRLAALIDRLNLPVNETTRGRVMGDVILFKHKSEAHPVSRIATRVDDAIAVADAACSELERTVSQ